MNIDKFKKCVKSLIDLDYRLAKAPETPESLENDLLVEIGTYFNVLRMLEDESYLDAICRYIHRCAECKTQGLLRIDKGGGEDEK